MKSFIHLISNMDPLFLFSFLNLNPPFLIHPRNLRKNVMFISFHKHMPFAKSHQFWDEGCSISYSKDILRIHKQVDFKFVFSKSYFLDA
jgi:hypothetical protein